LACVVSTQGFWLDHQPLIYTMLFIMIFVGVFAKIFLIFPAVAVNDELTVEEAFDLTEGHFFKIFVLATLIPVLTATGLEWLFKGEDFIVLALNVLVSNLVVVFEIAILSHVYQAFQTSKTVHCEPESITGLE